MGDLDVSMASMVWGVDGGEDLDELDLERFGGKAGGVPELLTGVEMELGERNGDGIGLLKMKKMIFD